MRRKRNPSRFTDRNGRASIDDFPLVPEPPKVIVELVGLDHPDHPINRAKRAEAQMTQSAPPAIPQGLPSRVSTANRGAPIPQTQQSSTTQSAPASQTAPREEGLPGRRLVEPGREDSHPQDHDLQPALADLLAAQSGPAKEARELLRKLTPRQLHELHCTVCDHPFRAVIDEEFVHWISPDTISKMHDVGWRCIYRHAHATGLFERRYRNLRSALGHIAECASDAMPTSRDVIRAIHHLARINARGEWIEPPTRVVVSSGNPTSTFGEQSRTTCGEQSRTIAAPLQPQRRAPKFPKRASRKTR